MDACRGVSALAIVVGHSYGAGAGSSLFNFVNQLRVAVPVFFGLSGFLLFRPYLIALARKQPAPRVRDFLRRRVVRIVPGYWFALTATAIILGPSIVHGVFSSHWLLLYGFGQAYSLTHNADGLAVAWTVSVEVSFYLFLPLFAAFTGWLARRVGWQRSTASGLTALFVTGMAIQALNQTLHPASLLTTIEQITYGLPGQLPYFVAGMALAAASVQLHIRGSLPRAMAWLTERPGVAWVLAAGCFALGATVGAYYSPVGLPGIGALSMPARFVLNGVLESVFVALFLLPAAFEVIPRRLPQRVLAWRFLGFVGLVSYGLYLWHVPLGGWLATHTALHQVNHWGLFARWPVLTAAILGAGLLAGTLSYYLVELPFLRLKPGWRGRPAVSDVEGPRAEEGDRAVARSVA
jgi:peptidoglycan/LPS O-acetylase OafA/YrhL